MERGRLSRGRDSDERGDSNNRRWSQVWDITCTNKEAYDAELYALIQAVKRFGRRGATGRSFTVFTDAQVALDRCRDDRVDPGQVLAKAIIRWSRVIVQNQGNTLMLRWIPVHMDVKGRYSSKGGSTE